jgi:GT2 family glycosyltransferase/SAM-dependent methyltransferase
MLQVQPWQLPVSPPHLARLASAAASAAVGDLLYPGTVFAAPPPGEAPLPPGPVPLPDLLATDVAVALDAVVNQPPAPAFGVATTAVVVCTRDRPEQLRRCLRGLLALDQRPDELVVVDNAPRNDAARRVAEEVGARYVLEPGPGLSRARNAGIAATIADVVAFTDDDVVVDPGWLGRLLAGFRSPDVMAVTGLVLPGALDTEAQRIFEDVVGGFGRGFRAWEVGPEWFHRHRRRTPPVWRLGAGASVAFRRAAFDRVGGFDPRLGAGAGGCSEDSELWYRLLAGGWRCRYEPWAVAYHFHRDSVPELHRQAYSYMRGHVAALAVQWSHTRQLGEPRRLLVTLPRHYLSRGARRMWWQADDPTLGADVRGYLAGLVRAPAMVRAAPMPLRPSPPRGPDAAGKAPLPEFLATNPFAHPRTLGLFYGEKMRAIHTVSPDHGADLVVEVGGGQSGLAAALYPAADVLTVDLDASFGSRSDLYGAPALDGAPDRRFVAGDATRLPVADDVADVVTLFDVLEHITDDVTAVREALRILRPGGHLLVSTPAETWKFPFYRVYHGCTPTDRQMMDVWGHVRRGYRVAELDRLVGRAHDTMATFITPVTVVAHDLAFSSLPQRVKRAVGLALAPVVWPASRLHRPTGVGTEIAVCWRIP